ncbi:hypothetical protein [Jiangella asiatica]|uniref:DUF423 domain-containing protein n=1 Tax=Jiangella asiatica TaxID=2530372 RepID=A0A4R5D6P0_9ACTN|nr:hypothetical protein [Jiangella asiatica]TDE08267.1 hypothetical protein E1269_18350 [Jiangella asiatica]
MLELSTEATRLAGILLLAAITIESGGWYLTRIARGHVPATDFQRAFARAGHGHAGMFVTLGLITAILTDATTLDGFAAWVARSGVPVAAIVMPAGFFFCSMGPGRTSPNKLIWLVWIGAAILAAGLATLGVGLLAA